jgi:murein DD-endopeptidase MepM/ murein hydrolase activator NlpD
MRQQAHPMRRPNRRRRIGLVALAVLALAVSAATTWRPSATTSASGSTVGPDAATMTGEVPGRAQAPDAAPDVAGPLTTIVGPQPTLPATSEANAPIAFAPVSRLERLALGLGEPSMALTLLTGYVWPLAHPRLTLPFGPTPWGTRVVDGQLFHDGVDLATFCGDRIMAAHDGVVLAAGRHFDNAIGWVGDLTAYYHLLDAKQMWNDLPIVVIIDDGNAYRSVYAHFSKVVVHVGQRVHAGQLIGYEGMTGHATGCHLHYGLFSPLETATFGIEPKVAKDLRLPTLEIARVDPLLVLPYRKGISVPPENLGSG